MNINLFKWAEMNGLSPDEFRGHLINAAIAMGAVEIEERSDKKPFVAWSKKVGEYKYSLAVIREKISD